MQRLDVSTHGTLGVAALDRAHSAPEPASSRWTSSSIPAIRSAAVRRGVSETARGRPREQQQQKRCRREERRAERRAGTRPRSSRSRAAARRRRIGGDFTAVRPFVNVDDALQVLDGLSKAVRAEEVSSPWGGLLTDPPLPRLSVAFLALVHPRSPPSLGWSSLRFGFSSSGGG